jgi:probable phosphoglycerate mutase
MSDLRLFIVRHGRTEMNRLGLLQGHGGFGLLPEGVRDAEEAATLLSGKRVTVLYSSDQRRAVETAAILQRRLGIRGTLRRSRLLREFDYGEMTGRPSAEVTRLFPLFRTDPTFVFPKGESFHHLQGRALRWFRGVLRRNRGGRAAVVSHGGWIRTLLAALAGVPLERALHGSIPHGLVAQVEVLGKSPPRALLLQPVSVFPEGTLPLRDPRSPD